MTRDKRNRPSPDEPESQKPDPRKPEGGTNRGQEPAEWDREPIDEEIREEFEEAGRLGSRTGDPEVDTRRGARDSGLAGGDVDADAGEASDSDETVGGSAPTPDQDVVEQIGESAGVTYNDNEPLHTFDKVHRRDEKRWELDPASSEDYEDREAERHRKSED